jgi:hypothetical protein
MAGRAARPMNIHQQASTPHRHSSGKDIAWQQWHLIAIEDRPNPGKVAPHCDWQRQFHATRSARQFPLEIPRAIRTLCSAVMVGAYGVHA